MSNYTDSRHRVGRNYGSLTRKVHDDGSVELKGVVFTKQGIVAAEAVKREGHYAYTFLRFTFKGWTYARRFEQFHGERGVVILAGKWLKEIVE